MARIAPIAVRDNTGFGTVANVEATLAHAPLALAAYTQWYPLYQEVERIVGKRLAYLYAYSIANAADCCVCSVFFRKIIVDGGERPETIELTEGERRLLDFGTSIAKCQGHIADHIFDPIAGNYNKQEMIILVAFAGQMIASSIFNNVIETDIEEELLPYLPPVRSIWKNA